MEDEIILMRLNGGPHAGDRTGPASMLGGWPLPDALPAEGGFYRKTNESQITDEQIATMTHVMRGAEYVWEPEG